MANVAEELFGQDKTAPPYEKLNGFLRCERLKIQTRVKYYRGENMSAVLEIQKTVPTTEVFQNGQILDARLISVKEYDRMIEHGILTSEDKVELLNGVIIKKCRKEQNTLR